jgi:hypothetical protein
MKGDIKQIIDLWDISLPNFERFDRWDLIFSISAEDSLLKWAPVKKAAHF